MAAAVVVAMAVAIAVAVAVTAAVAVAVMMAVITAAMLIKQNKLITAAVNACSKYHSEPVFI